MTRSAAEQLESAIVAALGTIPPDEAKDVYVVLPDDLQVDVRCLANDLLSLANEHFVTPVIVNEPSMKRTEGRALPAGTGLRGSDRR